MEETLKYKEALLNIVSLDYQGKSLADAQALAWSALKSKETFRIPS